MEETQIQSFIFPALASLILMWSLARFFCKPNTNKNPPPSPPKLPILGNLHQLSPFPHRDLQALARKHGALMLLHFGSLPVLIVSSADAAHEAMRTHDLAFSDRPQNKVQRKLLYDGKDVGFAPYGDHWRQARAICVLRLFSRRRIQSFRQIREEETARFVKTVGESPGPVDLSKMFYDFANNGICRAALGWKLSELEGGEKFVDLLKELAEVLGALAIGIYIPWLGWIDRVRGFDQRVEKVAKGLDDFLEGMIQAKGFSQESKNADNFLDIMLEIFNNDKNHDTADASIDKESIKAIILDVFAAGTDTSAVLLEWAMTELFANPNTMAKLQREVRQTVQHKQNITDDDLETMKYLKAVIKETLRLHPPLPLLLPRMTRDDVRIKGYDVAAGTLVMVNVWAIGRDPASWVDEPEKFKPERFLESSIDYKGMDFEFIPFGAGRRGCPGIAYSISSVELLLANLLQKFDWKLAGGVEGEGVDMREKPGLTSPRDVPLLAVATVAT